MNADGTDPSRFTDTLTYRISWSPDGSKFAFDGISFAFVNSDGRDITKATAFCGQNVTPIPVWAPDSKHIAFVGRCFPATPEKQTTRGVPSHIFVVPVKEILSDPKMLWSSIEAFRVGGLPTGWDVIDFAWSPDSRQIAFSTTRGHIAVVDVDRGRLETLTEWNAGFFSFTPTWSPDGNKILFGSVDIDTATGEPLGHGSDIKVINADGSNELKLAKGVNPRWSPDNRKFTFEREGMIYVKFVNGGIETALAEGADPVWSPDGKMIAFVRSVIAQPTDQRTTRDSTESSQNQVFSAPSSSVNMTITGLAGYLEEVPVESWVSEYQRLFVGAWRWNWPDNSGRFCAQTLSAQDGSFSLEIPSTCFSNGEAVYLTTGGYPACPILAFRSGSIPSIDSLKGGPSVTDC